MKPHAPRGHYRKGLDRRAEVVDSAMSIFARYGYRGGSLRMIADDAGTDAAALVRMFGSKEHLLEKVMVEWDRRSQEVLTPAGIGLAYFDGFVTLMADHSGSRGLIELFLSISTEASNPDHPAHAFIVERFQRVQSAALAQMDRARERSEVAPMTDAQAASEVRALLAYMDGIELQWLINPQLNLSQEFSHHYGRVRRNWIRGD